MVVLGDSVPWGQGLGEQQKYQFIVENELAARYPDISKVALAHSGAVIGAGLDRAAAAIHGEVPAPHPTMLEQCEGYTHKPDSVRLVLVNGGINDIDIRVILNPLISPVFLHANIKLVCLDDMLVLLRALSARFSHPDCRILLTGYYPVLSPRSHVPWIPGLLDYYGIACPSFLDAGAVIGEVVRHSMQFWKESTDCLEIAVAECNRLVGGPPRVFFVNPPFTEDNAVFAPNPWLYGLNPDFSPEDPIAAERHAACDLHIKPVDFLGREGCYRASAGHPNAIGSLAYAKAILACLESIGV
ncbi:MAG: SGNH/GDSL hydrolase family protein [Bryobacteraceae bacterium]